MSCANCSERPYGIPHLKRNVVEVRKCGVGHGSKPSRFVSSLFPPFSEAIHSQMSRVAGQAIHCPQLYTTAVSWSPQAALLTNWCSQPLSKKRESNLIRFQNGKGSTSEQKLHSQQSNRWCLVRNQRCVITFGEVPRFESGYKQLNASHTHNDRYFVSCSIFLSLRWMGDEDANYSRQQCSTKHEMTIFFDTLLM